MTCCVWRPLLVTSTPLHRAHGVETTLVIKPAHSRIAIFTYLHSRCSQEYVVYKYDRTTVAYLLQQEPPFNNCLVFAHARQMQSKQRQGPPSNMSPDLTNLSNQKASTVKITIFHTSPTCCKHRASVMSFSHPPERTGSRYAPRTNKLDYSSRKLGEF